MQLPVIAMLMALLGLIAYQDFKERAISAWTLIILLVLSIWLSSFQLDFKTILFNGLINVGFIGVQLALISLYFSIKSRQWIDITKAHIGWGDVLFFIPLAVLFSTGYFVLFYVLSLLVSLVGFLIYKGLVNRAVVTIPLAGLLAFCLIAVLMASWWMEVDLYAACLI